MNQYLKTTYALPIHLSEYLKSNKTLYVGRLEDEPDGRFPQLFSSYKNIANEKIATGKNGIIKPVAVASPRPCSIPRPIKPPIKAPEPRP